MTSDDKKENQISGISLENEDVVPQSPSAGDEALPINNMPDTENSMAFADDGFGDSSIERAPIVESAAALSAEMADDIPAGGDTQQYQPVSEMQETPEKPEEIAAHHDDVHEMSGRNFDADPGDDSFMDDDLLDDDMMEGDMFDDLESDIHITGDESVDFADEDDIGYIKKSRSGGRSMRLAAPLLVLLLAAGAGAYIVANPSIVGGDKAGHTGSIGQAELAAAEPFIMPEYNHQDMAAGNTGADMINSGSDIPQPVATGNLVPRMPSVENDLADNLSGDVWGDSDPALAIAHDDSQSEGDIAGYDEADIALSDSLAALEAELVEPDVMAEPAPELESAPDLELELDEQSAAAAETETDMTTRMSAVADTVIEDSPADYNDVQTDLALAMPAMDDGDIEQGSSEPEVHDEAPPILQIVGDYLDTAKTAGSIIRETTNVTAPEMPVNTHTRVADAAGVATSTGNVNDRSQAASSASSYNEAMSDVSAQPTEQSRPLLARDSSAYYDSRGTTLPPTGRDAASAGLRSVDPVTEPGSKFVVVNRDRPAGDYESGVVAASRALKLKRYDSALSMYQGLYERNKRDPRVLMGLGVAQQNQGLSEAALQTYDRLLALDKNNADALVNMLGILKQQYPAVALRRLQELSKDHPSNAMVVAQLGVTYADQGDTDQAFRYLGIASSLEPENAQHLFNIAIIADRIGKRSEAIRYYERALETDAVYGGGRSIPRDVIYDRLAVLRR